MSFGAVLDGKLLNLRHYGLCGALHSYNGY